MVIASNGEVTANNGYALSGYIPVEKGCIVTNKSDSIGMDDDPTYFYVAEFNNGVFDVRTPVNSGEKAKLKDTTNSIRICFGYVTLSGNTITTEDLGQHFKCEMLQRALTKKDIIGIEESLTNRLEPISKSSGYMLEDGTVATGPSDRIYVC